MKRVLFIPVSATGIFLAVVFWLMPFSQLLDGVVYDFGLRFGEISERNDNIVVVGIDDESLNTFHAPLVLWHNQLAAVIEAIGVGGAKRLAIDLIPAASMEEIQPELDRNLMRAMRFATRQGTQVLLGFSIGQYGVMPERKFAFAASNLGFLNLFPDPDGVIRKQVASMQGRDGKIAYSSAMLLAGIDALENAASLNDTFINYRQPLPQTISFLHVQKLMEKNDTAALQALFRDRLVLIGTTTRKMQDVHKVPKLQHLSRDGFIPGVYILALMTSSLQTGAIIRQLPGKISLILLILFGMLSTYFFLFRPPLRAALYFTGLTGMAMGLTYLIMSFDYVLPASAIVVGLVIPAMLSLLFRLAHEYQLQSVLNRFFKGYVNPERLEHLLKNPRARLRQERELKKGIDNNELVLYYQPKIEIQTGTIVGMEALVRWIKPNGECVSPASFIPLAEETGMVTQLTGIIFENACIFAHHLESVLKDKMIKAPTISVNLSARDIEQPDLAGLLMQMVRQQNIKPHQLDLEITESSVINGIERATETISNLQKTGFTISIDDFGSGFSSLGYITQIPHDYLKIDKSLMDNITTDRRSLAVVRAIIAMAQGLQSKVIAEGVEDKQQLQQLRLLNCDHVQGYIFCRPMKAEEIVTLIQSGRKFA